MAAVVSMDVARSPLIISFQSSDGYSFVSVVTVVPIIDFVLLLPPTLVSIDCC